MRLCIPPNLSFGLCPGSPKPPQICGTFFVKGTLQLRPGEPAVWADEPEQVSGDLYTDDDPTKSLRYPSDFAVFKPRTDIVVVGHAHASGGKPTSFLQVRVTVGRFSKALDVFGDRTWKAGRDGTPTYSPPSPFTKMSLGYECAL